MHLSKQAYAAVMLQIGSRKVDFAIYLLINIEYEYLMMVIF